MGTITSPGLGL